MNCFTHANVTAVAQCSNNCGRSLCQECAHQFNPPLCSSCMAQRTAEYRSFYRTRIIKNAIYYALVIWAVLYGYFSADANSYGYLAILALGYGFIMGRNGLGAAWGVPGVAIAVSLEVAIGMRLLHAAMVGLGSLVAVPFVLLADINRLSKLPAQA